MTQKSKMAAIRSKMAERNGKGRYGFLEFAFIQYVNK